MKNRWHFAIIFVLFIILAYFVFSIVENFYSRNGGENILEINPGKSNPENTNSSADAESTDSNSEEQPEKIIEPNSIKINITGADCDNECTKFKDDTELEYCERICGISVLYDYGDEETSNDSDDSEEAPLDCSKKTGIKKDYCLKDLAVEKSDAKICDQIIDSAVKKTCTNRILEDFLEEQPAQN